MRFTAARLPSAPLIFAMTRSSTRHDSTGTSLSSFPKTVYPIFLTVSFSPSCDTTPTQLPPCTGACFAAPCFGRFCLAGAGCAMAAPTPFRSNSNAVMVRLMLVPSQWMCPEILQKWLKPEIGFYEPARLELHNCHEVLQIGNWHRDNRAD